MSVLGADDLSRLLGFARKPSNRSVARSAFATEAAWDPALAFMSYTGVRRGECLALRWTDLDLDAGYGRDRRHDGFLTASCRIVLAVRTMLK